MSWSSILTIIMQYGEPALQALVTGGIAGLKAYIMGLLTPAPVPNAPVCERAAGAGVTVASLDSATKELLALDVS